MGALIENNDIIMGLLEKFKGFCLDFRVPSQEIEKMLKWLGIRFANHPDKVDQFVDDISERVKINEVIQKVVNQMVLDNCGNNVIINVEEKLEVHPQEVLLKEFDKHRVEFDHNIVKNSGSALYSDQEYLFNLFHDSLENAKPLVGLYLVESI